MSSAKYTAAATATGGTSASAAAIAPWSALPPLKRCSSTFAYRTKTRCTLARQPNARHCSSPSAAMTARKFIGEESVSQLRAVAELLERFGIGQCLDVLHRIAVHDVAHRQLDDLSALGARNVGHLHDFGGDGARRRVVAEWGCELLRLPLGRPTCLSALRH